MTKNSKRASKKSAVETVANQSLVTVETVERVETDAERETRERADFNAAVSDYRTRLVAAVERRADFERAKNVDNLTIQAKLKELRASVDHDVIAALFYVASVNADFINRAERATHRFNIYSARKVVNIARAVAAVETLNHYSRAIVASALSLESNDMLLTNADADSACSLSVKSDANRERFIVKYQSHVDAKTAATQASSSVNALQTMNVLLVTRDAANKEAFRLNRDSLVTQKLLEIIAR